MKKIISILVALGLVLGLTVMATPALADVSSATVDVDPACVCTNAEYTITFDITASLQEGTHCICIEFPEGTTVPDTFEDGDITVNVDPVFGSEVTVDGLKVCFLVPEDIPTASTVVVVFTLDADIENPCVPGDDYTLFVSTCRLPDADPVESAAYTIIPEFSSYEFVYDFSPTYPGLAEDFIPPFKACGQDYVAGGPETVWNGSVWFSPFTITLQNDGPPGCATPCAANATISFHLMSAPAGSTVSLELDATMYILTEPTDVCTPVDFDDVAMIDPVSYTWDGELHFDTVGEYEICFIAECPAPQCAEGGGIWQRCDTFKVYQWKDVYKIPLYRKWNLISLPLVPFETDIATLLAAYPSADEIISIWYYDRCLDVPTDDERWSVYGADIPGPDTGPYVSLDTMEDGKAYWVYITYDNTSADPTDHAGAALNGLWVWGTAKPMPPKSPSAYPVCIGWNMVGFTEMGAMWDDVYLWNFWDLLFAYPDYGALYSWDAPNQTWVVGIPWMYPMTPTLGYWIPFSVNGIIYPP